MWSNRPRSGLLYWIYIWLPVAIGIAIIVIESTEMFGSNHTSGPLRRIVEFFIGHMANARWELVHHYIRKTGHFFGYGFIGLAWLRAWWFTLPRTRFLQDAVLALLGTALVASCDEWHQSFLPNRTASAWDVLLDCTGAIVLQSLIYIFMRCFRPKHLDRAA
jgi:VanZ family protein